MYFHRIMLCTVTCAALLFCFSCQEPVGEPSPPDCVGTWEGVDQTTTWGLRDVIITIDADAHWECMYYDPGTDDLLEYSARGIFQGTVGANHVNLAYASERFYSGAWHTTDNSETPLVIWYELSSGNTEMVVEITDPRPTYTTNDVYMLTKTE